ncbi:2TM domain-containing protein [Pseudonocardia sp. RS010]|uniref:2TM domain-containing protein n=1 Tax=Pseudonocardia sp. RS010 TaxID=3385979 RepID=UPI0039A2E1E3
MSIDDRKDTAAVAGGPAEEQLRTEAVKRLEKKNGFWVHLLVYLAVNGMLVAVWAWTGAPFFWPVFPLVLWGIGLGANAWDAFRGPISERRIRSEMDRMRR